MHMHTHHIKIYMYSIHHTPITYVKCIKKEQKQITVSNNVLQVSLEKKDTTIIANVTKMKKLSGISQNTARHIKIITTTTITQIITRYYLRWSLHYPMLKQIFFFL